jgi:hypothetical protein
MVEVAGILAEDEFAVTFHEAAPGVALGILGMLQAGSGRRTVGKRGGIDRESRRALAADKTDTGGEAQGS